MKFLILVILGYICKLFLIPQITLVNIINNVKVLIIIEYSDYTKNKTSKFLIYTSIYESFMHLFYNCSKHHWPINRMTDVPKYFYTLSDISLTFS